MTKNKSGFIEKDNGNIFYDGEEFGFAPYSKDKVQEENNEFGFGEPNSKDQQKRKDLNYLKEFHPNIDVEAMMKMSQLELIKAKEKLLSLSDGKSKSENKAPELSVQEPQAISLRVYSRQQGEINPLQEAYNNLTDNPQDHEVAEFARQIANLSEFGKKQNNQTIFKSKESEIAVLRSENAVTICSDIKGVFYELLVDNNDKISFKKSNLHGFSENEDLNNIQRPMQNQDQFGFEEYGFYQENYKMSQQQEGGEIKEFASHCFNCAKSVVATAINAQSNNNIRG